MNVDGRTPIVPASGIQHGAHDRYEPGEDDRLAGAIPRDDVGGPSHGLLEAGSVRAIEQSRTRLPPDQVSGLGAEQRVGRGRDQHRRDREVELRSGRGRGEQSGGEEQRVAGQEEADQQAGLREQRDEDAEGSETT